MADTSDGPRRSERLRILLTEGSSLSARQLLFALGPGQTIDVLDPSPLCQCRFSRLVRRWYRCPSFTSDPCGYLKCLAGRIGSEPYDVLLPTHDEVFLLSRVRDKLAARIPVAIPDFSAVAQIHSKSSFFALLDQLQLPYPTTHVVRSLGDLEGFGEFPQFVKLDYGTAGQSVRRVNDRAQLKAAVQTFQDRGWWTPGEPLIVQQPAAGTQSVARAIFRRGELVAAHASKLRVRGVGGAATARVSADHPIVTQHLAALGRQLDWHGAMFVEYFYDEAAERPQYIEADPRIGDVGNATLSDVDLARQWIDVALDRQPAPLSQTPAIVRSHAGMVILLSKALEGASRREILGEMRAQWRGAGIYENSEDEMTRPADDRLSMLPYAWIAARLLFRPAAAGRIVRNTVENYALSAAAAERIGQMPLDELLACLDG